MALLEFSWCEEWGLGSNCGFKLFKLSNLTFKLSCEIDVRLFNFGHLFIKVQHDIIRMDVHMDYRAQRETLESVSSCTRFSGILKISNFGFNRSNSKLVGMFFGIVPMFVLKDFVQDCFIAQICAKMCVRAVIRAYLCDEAIRNKILGYEHWNYFNEHAYQF